MCVAGVDSVQCSETFDGSASRSEPTRWRPAAVAEHVTHVPPPALGGEMHGNGCAQIERSSSAGWHCKKPINLSYR